MSNSSQVIHKCVTTRHAKSAQRMGVDAISLDGFECGGHPGEEDIGNFVLQAQGGRELDVPFVCSGGVGTGKQVSAQVASLYRSFTYHSLHELASLFAAR